MSIIEETEKVIAQLPFEKAINLYYWLKQFEAARRYKHLKAYTMAAKAWAGFNKDNGNALWN